MNGKAIIFSAPSGAGKTTLVRHLLATIPSLSFSISACSRPQRASEENGEDYYFLSPKEFKSKIDSGAFLEWEEVYPEHFYGTLNAEIDRIWKAGKHVIFDVDVVGGLNLKKHFKDKAMAVFVQPPSIESLKERLLLRGSETQENLNKRVEKARSEMAYAKWFDISIINDDLDQAKKEAFDQVTAFLK